MLLFTSSNSEQNQLTLDLKIRLIIVENILLPGLYGDLFKLNNEFVKRKIFYKWLALLLNIIWE